VHDSAPLNNIESSVPQYIKKRDENVIKENEEYLKEIKNKL